ncbi:hypothetical protein INR49_025501, partial [Caranx melampygus]
MVMEPLTPSCTVTVPWHMFVFHVRAHTQPQMAQGRSQHETLRELLDRRWDLLTVTAPPEKKTDKCYDPQDASLRFVDREDEFDFLCEGFPSRRALMSCGHAVTPTSLTNWCRRLLDQGETKFTCGQFGCAVEWPFTEVRKMALLTPEETRYFEKTLAYNANRENMRSCPGCGSSVVRQDASDLKVPCGVCTAKSGQAYAFCWQCNRKWKGRAPRSDRCENDGCCNHSLITLKNCPEITFKAVEGVTGCPAIRACPTCGSLMEHSKRFCKTTICPRCKILHSRGGVGLELSPLTSRSQDDDRLALQDFGGDPVCQ